MKKINKNKKHVIEKDNILGCYVVWEIDGSLKTEVHRDKTEKKCKTWLERRAK